MSLCDLNWCGNNHSVKCALVPLEKIHTHKSHRSTSVCGALFTKARRIDQNDAFAFQFADFVVNGILNNFDIVNFSFKWLLCC